MTTLKLSDLSGPDADGWSDVAVFVRADGSESEPFVVLDQQPAFDATLIHKVAFVNSRSPESGNRAVRRLGRGRLVPSRIEMQGETIQPGIEALQEQAVALREALKVELKILSEYNTGSTHWDGCEISHPRCRAIARLKEALAATAPKEERP